MEITQTIVTVAAFSALFASITYAISLIVALIRGREIKVISRMAMRKQLQNTFIDIDFNLTEKDTDETAVQKVVDAYDRLGVAFEVVKSDFEAEQDRKRNATPPVFQDPTAAEKSRVPGKKGKKNKRNK